MSCECSGGEQHHRRITRPDSAGAERQSRLFREKKWASREPTQPSVLQDAQRVAPPLPFGPEFPFPLKVNERKPGASF